MRFLLDENIPEDAVVALRNEGHDVVWIPETTLRGVSDEVIWDLAARQERVLVTEDLDFPLAGPRPPGLVLLRGFDRISSAMLAALLLDGLRAAAEQLPDHILVISPGRFRLRRFQPT